MRILEGLYYMKIIDSSFKKNIEDILEEMNNIQLY